MKSTFFSILIFFFEFKANRLRPTIVKYLYDQKAYWGEKLEEFHNGNKVMRDMFQDEQRMLKNIHDIEAELAFENSYQLLKLKYRKQKKELAAIASEYHTFWTCLDFFRVNQGLNSADPIYANTALKVGGTKIQIYKRFQELLAVLPNN